MRSLTTSTTAGGTTAFAARSSSQFVVWMLAQLGAQSGDQVVHLCPGSGAIGRAWALYHALGLNVAWDASLRDGS